LITVSH